MISLDTRKTNFMTINEFIIILLVEFLKVLEQIILFKVLVSSVRES